ncbi:hypothetical protein WJX82_011741 [Trebouxia sp. C0006]
MYRTLGGSSGPALWLFSSLLSPFKSARKQAILPTGSTPVPATSKVNIDAALQQLTDKKQQWVMQPCARRAELLRACVQQALLIKDEAVDETVRVKGAYSTGKAEEMMIYMVIITEMRELAEAMEAEGAPQPHALYQRPNGQWVADVFPLGLEGILYGGFKGELWMQPGKEPTQGAIYRTKAKGLKSHGGVSLVLGAGNQASVVAGDILFKLIHEDEVVIVKTNPVNEYVGKHLEKAFKPFVDAGYLAFVYGGGEEGKHLCNHPAVHSIHLTGSEATYDAIVWGPGKPKTGQPQQSREVTAELGCITPYIVCPGHWSLADLEYHAGTVVAGMTHNAGHNCLKAEVLLLDKDWPQREAFLTALRKALDEEQQRVAYYPNSDSKFQRFKKAFQGVEERGAQPMQTNGFKTAPWLLKTGLTPQEADVTHENWVGVLQQIDISGGGNPESFLPKAVSFANDKCWGTLSCALIVDLVTQKTNATAVDTAIADLRYGSVNVNLPTILGYAVTKMAWGGFPGSTPQDIQSGNCFAHNTLLYDNIQKGVLYGPWRMPITPFWSSHHKNAFNMIQAVTNFVAKPNMADLNKAAVAALWG